MSISSELKSFLLTMCIEVPESTTNIRSSVFWEKVALSSALNIYNFFSPNSMLLCGRTLLVVRSPQVLFPQTSARKDFAHEVHLFG